MMSPPMATGISVCQGSGIVHSNADVFVGYDGIRSRGGLLVPRKFLMPHCATCGSM